MGDGRSRHEEVNDMSFILTCAGIGAAMGLLAGLLGVGGGVIAVPAMIYFLKMDPRLAIGTSLAVIVPVSISGSVKHLLNDNVDLKAGICLAVGGIAFAYLGAWLCHALDPTWLRRLFAVFLLLVGVKMLFEAPAPKEEAPGPAATETSAKP
jgi:uncharacterized membrane protein YfcA